MCGDYFAIVPNRVRADSTWYNRQVKFGLCCAGERVHPCFPLTGRYFDRFYILL